MKSSLTALSLVFVAGFLAGCMGVPGSPQGSAVPASGQATEPVGAEGGPRTDWDHPFMGKGRTNVDASALAASPQSFGTPIRPVTPQLSGGKLRWVDVSAGGTVAYMFDVTGDPALLTDDRVTVEESQSSMTQDQLINGKWVGTKNSLTPVGAITILVRSNQGLADASFVDDGTLYDVTGPDLGPEPALSIATELAKQLS